jgi:hypothetical protein
VAVEQRDRVESLGAGQAGAGMGGEVPSMLAELDDLGVPI